MQNGHGAILDRAGCISLCANALRKSMDLFLLSPAMDEILR